MPENLQIIISATDKASDVMRGIAKEAQGLSGVLGTALKASFLGAAAGATALGAVLAKSVGEASASETALAKLDAVLKATGAAAEEQARRYSAALGETTVVIVESKEEQEKLTREWEKAKEEYAKLPDELRRAQAHLADLEDAWRKQKTHTRMGAIALEDARKRVAELQAQLAKGEPQLNFTKKTVLLTEALGLTPPVARMTRDEILKLATSLQKVTRFSDETIIAAQTVLLQFRSIGKDTFPKATEAALNLATALGVDASSAARMLGKALETPGEGLLRLKAAGVAFTEAQEKQIEKMVKAGNVAGAQKLILDELEKSIGGAARAAGTTFAGQLDILSNQISDVLEEIGGAFLPTLKELVKWANDSVVPAFKTWAEENMPKIQEALKELGGFIEKQVVPALKTLFDKVREHWPAIQKTIGDAWGKIEPMLRDFHDFAEKTLTTALKTLFGEVQARWPAIRKAIEDAWNKIEAALAEFRRYLEKELPPALDVLYEKMSELEAVRREWENTFNELTSIVQQAFKDSNISAGVELPKLSSIVRTVLDGIISRTTTFHDTWKSLHRAANLAVRGDFANFGDAMADLNYNMLRTILAQVGITLPRFQDGFTSAFDGIREDARRWGADMRAQIERTLAEFVAAIQADAWDIINSLTEPFRRAFENISRIDWGGLAWQIGNAIHGTLAGWYDALVGVLAGPLQRARDAIASINWSDMAWQIGKAIHDMLASWADAIFSALYDPFSGAIQAIKRLLGLASPSRLMRQIGEDMAVGLAQGFASPRLALAPLVVESARGVQTVAPSITRTNNVSIYATVQSNEDIELLAYRVADVIARRGG